MGAIDQEYRATVAELPRELRALAAHLPFHLGLTERRGGGWEEYTRLEPFRALPRYATEGGGPEAPAPPSDMLARYERAHLRAGFFGLLSDRWADGQVEERPEWPRLQRHLLELWRGALVEATGDEALANRAVHAAVESWTEGLRREKALVRPGALPVARYVDLVSRKASWLGATSVCLLVRHGQQARLRDFRLAFDLLLLSSQCLDDVKDHAEDERLHGTSFAAALGLPLGGLLRAAPQVARLGVRIAREAGFIQLGEWMARRAGELDALRAPGDPLQNELAAMLFGDTVARLSQAVLSAGPSRAAH